MQEEAIKQNFTMNPAQKEAVTFYKGAALVLAGPGSGKTAVITRRVQYLLEYKGVNPREILVITFTKAAAREMQERFWKLMGSDIPGVTFGTFHAVFFQILKLAYGYRGSSILREEEQFQIIRELVEKEPLEYEDEKELVSSLLSEISRVKGEHMQVENYYSMNCAQEIFIRIYTGYESRLRSMGKIDFDDMMVLTYELFVNRPDILAMWQKRYHYLMVDEAQDSNRLQFLLTKMLAGEDGNLMLVGDDDQSLYGFRGARPELLLRFRQDYPDGKQIYLNVNYRSTGSIVAAASRVISHNRKRFVKELTAVKEEGNPVVARAFDNRKAENQWIISQIRSRHEAGQSYASMAVLTRTNVGPRALVNLFMEYNVPFWIRDVLPNLYEHWIAKDLFAYQKLACGEKSRGLMLLVANRPKRYLKREVFDEPVISFDRLRSFYADKPYMIQRIDQWQEDLDALSGMDPYATICYIRKAIGYDEFLKEYAGYRHISLEELMDIVEELQEDAKNYRSWDEWYSHMERYKEQLQKKSQRQKGLGEDEVSFMTYHSAKGLEFDTVYLPDSNETITPHHKAVSEADLEEERRMYYVAMTRAKKDLNVTFIKEQYGKKLEVSRFVGEFLWDDRRFQEGAAVIHKQYGKGTIEKREEDKVTIRFEKQVVPKVLSLSYCVQNQLLDAGLKQ